MVLLGLVYNPQPKFGWSNPQKLSPKMTTVSSVAPNITQASAWVYPLDVVSMWPTHPQHRTMYYQN